MNHFTDELLRQLVEEMREQNQLSREAMEENRRVNEYAMARDTAMLALHEKHEAREAAEAEHRETERRKHQIKQAVAGVGFEK